jgi:SET domain
MYKVGHIQIVGINDCFSIDASEVECLGRMINDATGKEINCAIKIIKIGLHPHLCFFATHDIMVGEELRYDYGVDDLPWRTKRKVNIFDNLTITMIAVRFNFKTFKLCI